MLDSNDKRGFRRMEADCRLTYRRANETAVHEGRCRNLSGNGVSFVGSVPVEAGQALEISVLPETPVTPPLDAYVEVIRCEREGNVYAIAAAIQAIKGL